MGLPIEDELDRQVHRVLDLEIALADAYADVQRLTQQLAEARTHLVALEAIADGRGVVRA